MSLQDHCDDLTDLYGLEPHRVVLDKRKRTGGHIFPELRHIVISAHMDIPAIEDTLRHELAHAKVYRDFGPYAESHGPQWKEAARLMGANPVACDAPITANLAHYRAARRRK